MDVYFRSCPRDVRVTTLIFIPSFKRDNVFYRVREGDPFGDLKSFTKTSQFWSRLIVPFDRLRLQCQRVNLSFTNDSFQFQRSLPMSPKATKRFFSNSSRSRRSFKMGFGRKVLPDWVIASRARIWFHPIFGGFAGSRMADTRVSAQRDLTGIWAGKRA
jgi:hypothetical protein